MITNQGIHEVCVLQAIYKKVLSTEGYGTVRNAAVMSGAESIGKASII